MWRTLLPFSLKTNNRTIISQIFLWRISFQFHPVSKTGGLLFLLLHFLCARSCFSGGRKGGETRISFYALLLLFSLSLSATRIQESRDKSCKIAQSEQTVLSHIIRVIKCIGIWGKMAFPQGNFAGEEKSAFDAWEKTKEGLAWLGRKPKRCDSGDACRNDISHKMYMRHKLFF